VRATVTNSVASFGSTLVDGIGYNRSTHSKAQAVGDSWAGLGRDLARLVLPSTPEIELSIETPRPRVETEIARRGKEKSQTASA
jgi:hypothetical protein